MLNILLIEDEIPIRLLTKAKLKNEYHIFEAANGVQALEVLEHEHVDFIIADIMMPEMDGYEFVDNLRSSGDMTPVIMLTAMNTFSHKKKGFSLGIDDYMTKPIDYEELKWRISAILRRSHIANEKHITIGDFHLNIEGMSVSWKGQDIKLTETEFQLLSKFLSYPDVVLTKQQLMDEIWGYDTETDYNTIKTYVNRLRKKFTGCDVFEIISVRGLGYKALIHE